MNHPLRRSLILVVRVAGAIMSRLILTFIFLAFSATAMGKHVYPQHLKKIENGATYKLVENYVFKEKAATFTLFTGNYVQEYEDSRAVYLIGGSNCLEFGVVPPKNPSAAWAEKWDCGIYLPKDPAKGAALFLIRKTPDKKSAGNGLIIDEMIKAGYGSFDFPTAKQNDAALRGKLIAVQL